MPTFLVTSPDGRKLKVTGDTPPSERELDEIFSSQAQPEQTQPEQPKKSFLETINPANWKPEKWGPVGALGNMAGEQLAKDVTKGAKLAEFVGRSASNLVGAPGGSFDPQEYENLPQGAKQFRYSPQEIDQKFGGETAGERFGQGFNEGSRTAAAVGKWFLNPGGGSGNVSTIAPKTFASKLGQSFSYGAGSSAAGSYGNEGDVGDVIASSIIGGLVSSSIFAGAEGFKKLGDVLQKKVAPGVYNSALDQPKSVVENEIRTGKYLADEALKRNVKGGSDSIIKQAKVEKKAAQEAIDDYVRSSLPPDYEMPTKMGLDEWVKSTPPEVLAEIPGAKTYDLKGIVDEVRNSTITQLKESGDDAGIAAINKISDSIIKNNGDKVTTAQAIAIRKSLDSQVSKTFGKEVTTIDSDASLLRRFIGDKLRDRIRINEPDIAPYLDDYHFWSRMEGAMISKKAGSDIFRGAGGTIPKNLQSVFSTAMKPFRSPMALTPIATGMYNAGAKTSGVSEGVQDPATQYAIRTITQLLQNKERP